MFLGNHYLYVYVIMYYVVIVTFPTATYVIVNMVKLY